MTAFSHPPSASITHRDNPAYESVSVRQRGAWDFASYYESLCVLQDACPLPMVKNNLHVNALDINADRVRFEDWPPIINSLKINKSIEFVAFRSYYSPQPDHIPTTRYPILKSARKVPSIQNKDVLNRLCCGLRQCLKTTTNLKVLELQGLALSDSDVDALSTGLANNNTLTRLSLEFCGIGDDSVDTLCNGLKHALSVWYLDLTCCDVSAAGAASLAKLVIYQSSLRHAEAWQDSLRYRRPNLDMLMGLRRIVLNGNTLLGDDGASHFSEALRDDLWLKALDLQKCGITTDGARALHEVLKFSVTMVVCDIRKNAFVDKEMVRAVTEQCLINCQGRDSEYPWLKIKSSENPDILKLRSKTAPTPRESANKRRGSKNKKKCKKLSAAAAGADKITDVPCEPGFPWRTALRVGRHKAYPPETAAQLYAPTRDQSISQYIVDERPEDSYNTESEASYDYRSAHHTSTLSAKSHSVSQHVPSNSETSADTRKLTIEFEKLKIKLDRETESRRRCDQRLIDLELDNSRLRRQLLSNRSEHTTAANLSEEQSVILDSVEETFQKFSKFLDLLRQAGFSDLADLAGLDSSDFKISAVSSRKRTSDSDSGADEASQTAGISKGGFHGGAGDAPNMRDSDVHRYGATDGNERLFSRSHPRSHEAGGDAQKGSYAPRNPETLMEEVERLTRESELKRKAASDRLNEYYDQTTAAANSENDVVGERAATKIDDDEYKSINIEDILNDDNGDDDVTPSPLPISILSENGGNTNSIDH